jgi:hypothetical protein
MRTKGFGSVGGIVGVMLGGLIAAGGCVGADEPATTEAEGALHGGHRVHRPHSTADAGTTGSSTADAAATADDCGICTQAAQCCLAVQSDPSGCSYSAATCSSMSDVARPYYVNACLTYVVSVRGAWSGNPPAACR